MGIDQSTLGTDTTVKQDRLTQYTFLLMTQTVQNAPLFLSRETMVEVSFVQPAVRNGIGNYAVMFIIRMETEKR